MAFAKNSLKFFYKMSYKNPSPAIPIYFLDFTTFLSSTAEFGS
jgi:hypothetical protein